MKNKLILLSAVAMLTMTTANAQDTDNRVFNHVAVGVDVGLQGFGFDVAMPVCKWVQVRAGVSIFPKIKINTDLDIGGLTGDVSSSISEQIPSTMEIEAKTGFTNGKVLFDVFPFASKTIHLTVGAYFGSSKIVEAYNTSGKEALAAIHDYNQATTGDKIGVELGDFLLEPDEDGNINACIKTASFKPYLGIGYGRAVPKKRRLGFMFELGCQFWGTPKLYCNGTELNENNVDGDAGGVIKVLSKIKVYPVMSFRLCGRIL